VDDAEVVAASCTLRRLGVRRTGDVMLLLFHVPPALRMRLRGTALARLYARSHAVVYARTAGRLGGALRVARGARPPVLLLVTIGRRSGTVRTTPLIYLRDGDDLVVIAANAGHPSDPAWWLNLAADPRATVQIGAERRAVVAHAAEGDRRDRLWRRFAAMYAGLEDYQRQARRRFPVVVLAPAERSASG
jgi:deazaflavin-dependent oxidoreductase (nitroreductase family)